MTDIQKILYAHRDEKYAAFTAKLIPTISSEVIIGVRSPEFKKIVKEVEGNVNVESFLNDLPHHYHEENILHVILIGRMKDYDACLEMTEKFLPYVDNWAVCDGFNPNVFKKHRDKLKGKIPGWIASCEPYTQRFGMRMVMAHFLEEDFEESFLKMAAEIRSDEYYVNMMRAWLFAEALVKQWNLAIGYIERHDFDRWTNNKAIQKAIESYRISEVQKQYLRTLRMK